MVNEDATPVLHPKTGQRPRAHMDALVQRVWYKNVEGTAYEYVLCIIT